MSVRSQKYIRAEQRRYQRASEGRAWSVKELPQYYYHRNFCEMITHVSTRYTPLMDAEHTTFIRDFEALPFPAQCAYARLAGRKGVIFNLHYLQYSEIENLQEQYQLLRDRSFIRSVSQADMRSYFLALTKPGLTDVLVDRVCETKFKRSWKKEKLVDVALEHIGFDDITIAENFIVQDRLNTFNYLLFLYFGEFETSLQQKTLGALGLVKPSQHNKSKHRFDSLEQAQSRFFYARALHTVKNQRDDEISDLVESVSVWPEPVDETTEIKRGKLIQKLGGLLERQGNIENALTLYDYTDNAACNERVIRLRFSRNEETDREWVKYRLEEMIENPESEHELVFAQDFYERKYNKKRTSDVTDLLRQSDIVFLDEAFKNAPERAAIRHFKEKGLGAYRSENRLWQSFFGLLFWGEIYGNQKPSAWQLPDALKSSAFYDTHKQSIEGKLLGLTDKSKSQMSLLKTMTANYGKQNGLFLWGDRSLEKIKTLIEGSHPDALAKMLRLMAQNYRLTKDGFPDLMLIENGQARFVEIKAEGDVLRRNQLTRLRQLKAAGYKADVLRVGWHIDPHQTYVVVDVETTGGRAGLHRVTEIGAVKIQSGEIIDKWSNLINPQRSIPPNITRITGITDAMVRDAPLFSEVADSFREFMGDAIFAAHNVNFDYGFINAEYQMIDQKFRHPKICTCSSMRKLYPGYKSYGLKNLCLEFQIDLETHHRALCDAKAAAELLKMINDKRIDMQSDA